MTPSIQGNKSQYDKNHQRTKPKMLTYTIGSRNVSPINLPNIIIHQIHLFAKDPKRFMVD